MRFLLPLLCLILFALPVAAIDKPDVTASLSPEVIAKLEAGQVLLLESQSQGATGGGVVVAIIDRAPDAVFSVLGDYGKYHEFMPSVEKVAVEKQEGQSYFLQYELKIVFKTVRYHVISTQAADKRSVTWRLDKSKDNDIKESRGGWWLSKHAPGKTLVIYTVAVDTGMNVPGPIADLLTEKTMPGAVKALKKRVESLPEGAK